jgi:glycosyltransferase involved in cell wall biosynthesis
VIIGPLALKDREGNKKSLGLEGLNNVYFLETKPYSEIVKYIAAFDVAVIPYQINDYTVGGCFPVKFHEELAAGLPVVVTDLPAYSPFGDVCYISKSYNEFSQNVRKALEENTPEKVKERKKIAKENTWEGKVNNILKVIWGLL